MTETIVALVTLTLLEVVLGIDNVIFISILAGRLPEGERARARRLGLIGAMGTRILLLLTITTIAKLTAPFLTLFEHPISWRDVILIGGGLFLIAKATWEIHDKLEGIHEGGTGGAAVSFARVIVQVMVLDIVFSLDSVITAVGMANEVWVMIAAVVLAVLVMLVATEPISRYVEAHPTIKILALSFLLLIGLSLVADGFGQHISKAYVYFAMGFSVFVEMINLRVRQRGQTVTLRRPYDR